MFIFTSPAQCSLRWQLAVVDNDKCLILFDFDHTHFANSVDLSVTTNLICSVKKGVHWHDINSFCWKLLHLSITYDDKNFQPHLRLVNFMFVSSGSAFIVLLTSNDPGFSTFLRGAEIPHAAYYHKIHVFWELLMLTSFWILLSESHSTNLCPNRGLMTRCSCLIDNTQMVLQCNARYEC